MIPKYYVHLNVNELNLYLINFKILFQTYFLIGYIFSFRLAYFFIFSYYFVFNFYSVNIFQALWTF